MISQTVITAFVWEHMPDTAILEILQHQHQFKAFHLVACNLLYCVYLCPSMSQLWTEQLHQFQRVKSQVVSGSHSVRKLCALDKR